MHTTRRIAFVPRLALVIAVTSVAVAEDATKPSFPKGVGEGYVTLAKAVLGADMPSFMGVFHRDFIYEAPDGASLDRGPWRRKWLDEFELVRYEKVTFEPLEIVSQDDEQVVVRTRSVVAYTRLDSGASRVRESVYEDTWWAGDPAWSMQFRLVVEVGSEGILDAAAKSVSPTLVALNEALSADETASLAAFRKRLEEKGAPVVEPIAGSDDSWVTFVWRGDGTESRVRMVGGWPAADRRKPLHRLRGTDLWYRSERFPPGALFTYQFHIEKEVRAPAFAGQPAETLVVGAPSPDPLNPRTEDESSWVALPGAPSLPVAARAPEGEIERHTLRSAALGERRFVSVYTPPGYSADGAVYPALFLLDESTYASRRTTGLVLDRLIAAKKIRPLVAFLVHSEGSRRRTLEVSEEFLEFLGGELLVWASETYHVSDAAKDRLIGGTRQGSALAAMLALRRAGSFGSVFSEGGDFSVGLGGSPGVEGNTVTSLLGASGVVPLRFWLVAGALDGEPVVESNRHLRDLLKVKGYACDYAAPIANHNQVVWLHALGRVLEATVSP